MNPKTTYCYQGVPGCYSQQACLGVSFKNHKNPTPKTQECTFFSDVFQSVIHEGHYGVIPVENSLGGSIHENFDLIQNYHQEIEVVQEYNLRIEHCLMALPGVSIGDIRRVESHPQALAQCRDTLTKLFPKKNYSVERVPIHDTAFGAKQLSEKIESDVYDPILESTAIIASQEAAKRYGLDIIQESIEDTPQNYTRFWVIRRRPDNHVGTFQISRKTETNLYKHSILFSLEHSSGSLSKILSIFSVCNANLTKIESRPFRNSGEKGLPFQYWFFVDFMEELATDYASRVVPMLTNLLGTVIYQLKSLGIYPCDETVYVPQHSLNIGIVGGGAFGRCMASLLDSTHHILLTSRSDYSKECRDRGWTFYPTMEEWNRTKKDVILIAVSIDSFESVVEQIDFQDELVVDVLSVKQFPKQILLEKTPPSCDILATHPMFGPKSIGKKDRPPCILEKVRIQHKVRCQYFLESITNHCRLVEMSCQQHDQDVAIYQALTHYVNRLLNKSSFTKANLERVPRSCQLLVESGHLTLGDSDSLFASLFDYNPAAKQLLKKMDTQHNNLRNQIIYHSGKINNTSTPAHFLSLPIKIGTNEFDAIIKKQRADLVAQESDSEKTNNPDGPSITEIAELHIGEPQYKPPESVYQLLQETGQKKDRVVYTSVLGTQACRQSIIDHYLLKGLEYKIDEVICCNGGKQAIYQALIALTDQPPINGGQWEVVVPIPYWGPYQKMVCSSQAKIVYLETTPNENYQINIQTLRQCLNSNSRILILCSPHNPTGIIYSKECLEHIVKVCDVYQDLHIIWDEIYSDLILDETLSYPSLLQIAPHLKDRIITINGFSKTYAMTGFRIGYALGRKEIIDKMAYYQGQITSSAGDLSQQAAILSLNAYRNTDYVSIICQGLIKNRDIMLSCLDEINGLVFTRPIGGMYIYLNLEKVGIRDTYRWCCDMVEKYGVAMMPGVVFGDPTAVRICFAVGKSWIRRATTLFKKEFTNKLTNNK